MPALDAAFEKVRWAIEHLNEFERRKKEFVDSHAYRVRHEFDGEEREDLVVSSEGFRAIQESVLPQYYRRIGNDKVIVSVLKTEYVRCSLDIVRPLPQVEWAVMIGNIVHSLRSALDVLVWELSVQHQASLTDGLPPPVEPLSLNTPWRNTHFPIVTDGTKWKDEFRNGCSLIDQTLFTEFLPLQPWYTGQNSGRPPEGEWLAILQELWNRDKHRGVTFIGADAQLHGVTLWDREGGSELQMVRARQIELTPFGPVEHGTPLGRFALDSSVSLFGGLKVGMYSHLTFNVMFAEGSPAEGHSVSYVIETLAELVTSILEHFLPQYVQGERASRSSKAYGSDLGSS